jgi:hypothetical protein
MTEPVYPQRVMKQSRPASIYALIGLQGVIGVMMLFAFQGLTIPIPPLETFNIGFPLGIIDLILIVGLVLRKQWGKTGVLITAVIGISATVLGTIQIILTPTITSAPIGTPPLELLAPVVVVGSLILYLLARPETRSYFAQRTRRAKVV